MPTGRAAFRFVPDHADGTVTTIVLGAERKSADEWWAALLARQDEREQALKITVPSLVSLSRGRATTHKFVASGCRRRRCS
jgi:hypothetical protein